MSDSADHVQHLSAQCKAIVGESNVRVMEPLCRHTTFRIGGPCDIYVIPDTYDEVRDIVALCRTNNVPYYILGRGSDLLVSDAGYRGVVIALSDGLVNVTYEGEEITCQAGVTLREASEMACELGLTGFEFACGIPGSIGGGLFMNAGAYDGCIADIVDSIKALTPEGTIVTIPASELHLGYRQSRVQEDNLVVLAATFRLHEGKSEDIRAKMDDFTQRRREKQPLEYPSAGSTFKRPEGYYVGKLLTDAGLKGYRSGGAAVSEKHAGFVINVDHATAADVIAVITHVQHEIKRLNGVDLEPEIRFLGEF